MENEIERRIILSGRDARYPQPCRCLLGEMVKCRHRGWQYVIVGDWHLIDRSIRQLVWPRYENRPGVFYLSTWGFMWRRFTGQIR